MALRQCTFDGCERPMQAKRLCSSHYWQQWMGRPLTPVARGLSVADRFWAKVEKTNGCWLWTGGKDGQFRVGDGHTVSAHRWAYQDAYGEKKGYAYLIRACGTAYCVRPDHIEPAWGTREEMFWAKVNKTDTCWLWTASTVNGYGQFGVGWPQTVGAHRWAYEAMHGPIPAGMQIDHICRIRLCVNPSHLRVVTNKQNHENMVAQKRSQTGARGVYYDKRGYYYVQVTHNGQRHCRGTFATKAEAERVAIALRNSLFTHNDTDRVAS